MKKYLLPMILIGAATLGADQATKLWVRGALKGNSGIVLVENYFKFEYHENTGMAFGVGRNIPGARFLFLGVGILVLIFVWRIIRDLQRRQKLAAVAFGLVAGGALGNMIDRVYLGYVVDFILMHWKYKYVWPGVQHSRCVTLRGCCASHDRLGWKPSTWRSDGTQAIGKKVEAGVTEELRTQKPAPKTINVDRRCAERISGANRMELPTQRAPVAFFGGHPHARLGGRSGEQAACDTLSSTRALQTPMLSYPLAR